MPIFMDRHEILGAAAEQVAAAHQKDLQVQTKYGCKAITYWFDETSGLAFCLIEAPGIQAVIDMHNDAHGLVPNKVIQVDEHTVQSFLGRISDPFTGQKKMKSRTINETGLRTLLHLQTKYPDGYFRYANDKKESSATRLLDELSSKLINDSGGAKVKEDVSGVMNSFKNHSDALKCGESIQSGISGNRIPVTVSIGISTGPPVSETGEFFEEAIKKAKNLSFTAPPGKIFVSSELGQLIGNHSRPKTSQKMIRTLTRSEEEFLNKLIDYAEKNRNDDNTGLDHCCESLGVSRSGLYRNTIALTGYSPSGFMKEYRLRIALEKIKSRLGNVTEIAFDSGFNTPSYFTQCFKERFGILPSDYLSQIS